MRFLVILTVLLGLNAAAFAASSKKITPPTKQDYLALSEGNFKRGGYLGGLSSLISYVQKYKDFDGRPRVGRWVHSICDGEGFSLTQCLTYAYLASMVQVERQMTMRYENEILRDAMSELKMEIWVQNKKILGSKKTGREVLALIADLESGNNGYDHLIKPARRKVRPTFKATTEWVPEEFQSNWERNQKKSFAPQVGLDIELPYNWDKKLLGWEDEDTSRKDD